MSQKQDSSWSWLFWQSGRKRYLVFYCTMCDYVRWWDWRREAMAGLISVMCCCRFVFWDNQQLKVLSGVNTEPLKRHTNQNITEWQGLLYNSSVAWTLRLAVHQSLLNRSSPFLRHLLLQILLHLSFLQILLYLGLFIAKGSGGHCKSTAAPWGTLKIQDREYKLIQAKEVLIV